MAQGACTGGGKISKQIAKPMAAAQDAMKARKWQEVLTRTREAESTPGNKSQFDLYWMAEFRGYAYHNLKQTAEAARELETALNSPCMPEANKLERYKSLAGLYSALRNYPKVIEKKKAYDAPDSPYTEITKEQVPERYNDKTELKVEVKPGTNELPFDLKAP